MDAASAFLLGGSLLLAGLLLGLVVAGGRTMPGELTFITVVQRPDWLWLDQLAWVASRLGDAWPALIAVSLLTAALAVARQRRDLAVLLIVATALRAVGPSLKWLFASPRPPESLFSLLEQGDGLGYPSGHAFGAALVYGSIALVLPCLWPCRLARFAPLLLVVLIPWSRLRLGVHWPTDVLGGLLFGGGALLMLWGMLHLWWVRADAPLGE